jgi:group I intron endonuclease
MFIYKFTNPINNKCYIGITKNSLSKLSIRYNFDVKHNSKTNRPISLALQKYGIDNFKFEIIKDDITDYKELLLLEKYFIKQYDSIKHGYNVTTGGEETQLFGKANPNYGKKAWNNGVKMSKELRLAASLRQKGKTLSDSHLAAIRANGLREQIKITKEQENKLIFLYGKGASREIIAKTLNIGVQVYKRIIKDLIKSGDLVKREINTIFEEEYVN